MHSGKAYTFREFVIWTRRNLYWLILVGTVPTVLYEVMGLKFVGLPFTVVALLGTATAFLIGFKNTQTYNRTWEARQIWGAILNSSRAWATMSRDFINDPAKTKLLVYRHFAWLTAMRFQLRASREWETTEEEYNREYRRFFSIPERESTIEKELATYLNEDELKAILATKNRAAQLLSLQSKTTRELFDQQQLDSYQFVEMQRAIKDLFDQQGKSERIKNFPYPRQFATINALFIRLFCLLLPFGLLREFDMLNQGINGWLQGKMVWMVIPFSVLISWVYTSLEQVGQSTENPFEGSSNDVPITQISRTIEIDMREMLGETELPPAILPVNKIVL